MAGAKVVWKARVQPRVRFFAWLALQDRCWTAERRQRHGLQETDDCALCDQAVETMEHLLTKCPFVSEIWFKIFSALGWISRLPPPNMSFLDWWLRERKGFGKLPRRGFDALLLLVAWMERNDRVFRGKASSLRGLLKRMVEEANLWALAGVVDIDLLLAGVVASSWSQMGL
ncbi:LOW QUALITY PROTEIN: hypothetical protein U9M48_005535, partial [Paspalum notatum var. saurae]